jgi:biopolymer transport protein ExbD
MRALPDTRPPLRLAIEEHATRGGRRSLIGLTPLVDVVFILLVFFMLASSFLDWRTIELNVPAAGAAAGGEALVVEVSTDGLMVAGEPVTLDQIAARLGDAVAAGLDRQVVLRPVGGASLQRLVLVLDRLTAAGAADVSLVRQAAP